METEKQEKNWLVKTSSRIMGPYTPSEIAQLLLKKHISIIDEVRSPKKRWTYIRETPIFLDVVQNLRKEQANTSEETASAGTQTISKTAEVTRNDLTPTPLVITEVTPKALPDEENKVMETIAVKDVTPIVDTIPHIEPEKSFGSEDDNRLQQVIREKSKNFNLMLWGVVGILVLSVGFFIVNKMRAPTMDQKKLIERALRYKSLHLYSQSLDAYKKAQVIKEPDFKTQLEMGLVLVQLEKQSLATRRVFISAMSDSSMPPEQRVDALIGVGLSYMLENDLKMAQDYYQKALSFDPNNVPAQLNIAFLEIRKGDVGKAAELMKKILPSAKYDYADNLGKAVLIAEQKKAHANEEMLRELSSYIKESKPWRKEIALLLAYAYTLEKNFTALNDVLKTIIDLPIRQSKDFAVDLRLDPTFADWEYLDRYCQDIYSQAPLSAWTRALRISCFLEQDREGDTQKLISEALAQNPSEPVILLTQAQALYKSGRYQEASTVLKAPSLANFKTTPYLLGRMCRILGESVCAEQNLDKALKINRENLAVVAEYASLKLENKTAAAKHLISEGLQREPLYKPLIELREKVENP